MGRLASVLFCFALAGLLSVTAFAQQVADPLFNPGVEDPAFTKNFPRVLFDEAHNNSETTTGRYKPFADLIFNDGYHLALNRQLFTKEVLKTFKILVIANPLGAEDVDEADAGETAFTPAECDAVIAWIRDGGALLLLVDQAPFSSATELLAKKLGVDMSQSNATDPANSYKESNNPSLILYSRENHSLADHPIRNGRNAAERINRVIVFAGQSLQGPAGSDAFLKLADTAVEAEPVTEKNRSAAGRAQGIAFRLDKGRVVVLGDAAMLSAQLTGSGNQPFGMNVPEIDNRQLTLNIMHWLSGLLK